MRFAIDCLCRRFNKFMGLRFVLQYLAFGLVGLIVGRMWIGC